MNIKKVLKVEADELSKIKEVGNKQIQDYLISLKLQDGSIHNVLPNNQDSKEELIEDLLSYSKLSLPNSQTEVEIPEKIVFHNRENSYRHQVSTRATFE